MGGGWVFVLDDIVYKCLWYSLLTTEYVYWLLSFLGRLVISLWVLFTFKDGVRLFSQDIGKSSGVRLTGDKFVGLVHF